MDREFFTLINSFAGKSQLLDFFGVFFAEYVGYFLIVGAIFAILSLGSWKEKIYYSSFVALAVILSRGIFTEIIRFFYHRPRPFSVLEGTVTLIEQTNKAAFPSGHMAFYFALVLPIIFIDKKWGWRMVWAAAFMGVGRVFVGVHWPFDIIGGILIGISSFYLIKFLLEKTT